MSMEKIYQSPVNSRSAFLESANSITSVPDSFLRIMAKFGFRTAIAIAINRLRYRVMCRILYSVDFLKTLQINYNQLSASKLTLFLVRRSIQSSFWRKVIYKIEHHFRPDYLKISEKIQSSKFDFNKIERMFNS